MLRPGHHQIRVTVSGKELGVWEFNLGASDRQAHEFRWQRETGRAPQRARPVPWIVTGVGAAALAAGGTMGFAALKKVRNIEKKCPDAACPPGSGFEDDVEAARSMVRATDVLLVTGGVLAAAGITWLLVDREPSNGETSGAKPTPLVGGGCDGRGCSAVVKVAF